VAILTRDNAWLQNLLVTHANKKVRLHALLKIPAEARVFRRQLLTIRDGPDLECFDRPTCLLVIDNKLAPTYDPAHMSTALKHYPDITIHKAPRAHWNDDLPPDIGPIRPILTHPNHTIGHPLESPSQTWYKARFAFNPIRRKDGTTPDALRPTPSDLLNPVLALFGSLPALIHKDIEEYNGFYDHNAEDKKAHPIAKLILSKTLELHQKDNAFRNWQNRRARWDG
jgi:hypothetical protein